MKIGLIGRGSIAGAHEAAYARIPEAEIVAVCDIRAERLEGLAEGVRTYRDIDEMLKAEAGRLDYVDICLPTYLHADVACRAMRAGYHVLSEKPMARTLTECEEMCRVAKETGRLLMAAYCNRFFTAFRTIKDYVDSGRFGGVVSAEFRREGGSRGPMGHENWFRNKELSGGAMLDLHIHDVDMLIALLGMPTAVSAMARNLIPGSGYDAMSVNYRFGDGAFANATCDWTIPHDKFNTRTIRVNLDGGYLFLDRTAKRTTFVAVATDGTVEDLSEQIATFDAYYNEIVYFMNCVKNGTQPTVCLPEASMLSVKLVEAEMRSADLGGELIKL